MFWHEGPLAVLDLEATGVDTRDARIIEVGLFLFEADGSSKTLVDRLIDPGVALPTEVSDLTGIRPEDLATSGGDPSAILVETRAAIAVLVDEGTPIVIYNAPYDWSLLTAELARYHVGDLPTVPPAILVDPLVLDRHVDRYRKGSRTLESVAAHYGVVIAGAHRAAADAAATVAVAREIPARYPEVRMSGADIVALQIESHGAWKKAFNEYLARVGASRLPITEKWPTG